MQIDSALDWTIRIAFEASPSQFLAVIPKDENFLENV